MVHPFGDPNPDAHLRSKPLEVFLKKHHAHPICVGVCE